MPDPCEISYGTLLKFEADGTVTSLKGDRTLIERFGLDAPHLIKFRRIKFKAYRNLMDMIEMYDEEIDEEFLEEINEEIDDLLGYPLEIPDLRKKRNKESTRPGSEESCYFARLERKEIPPYY